MVKHKAFILTWDGFQDQEVIYPYYRLQEEGFEVDIFANKEKGKVTGLFGTKFDCLSTYDIMWYGDNTNNYHLMVIPGGVKALEKLRQEKHMLRLIECWNNSGKIISSTCHGAQMLISAKVVKGRNISGYYSIKDDIENAGAIYVDEPVVIDRNIISSPHYKWMGPWMKATIEEYNKWLKEKNERDNEL